MKEGDNNLNHFSSDNFNHLEIFRAGLEVSYALEAINSIIPASDKHKKELGCTMITNIQEILDHIILAEKGDLYDIRMEHATMIRMKARKILSLSFSLDLHGYEEYEYLNILRTLIEEFRYAFIDWLEDCENANFIIDTWGLFNPPGINPLDEEFMEEFRDQEFEDDDDFDEYYEDEDWIDPDDESDDEDLPF